MRETYQNILNAVIVIFLIVAAILFYKQQKTINQLSSILNNQNNRIQAGKQIEKATVDPIDQVKKNLEDNTKFIEGRLISVSGNDLTVEADMPDFKKAKEINASKKLSTDKPGPPPTYKKVYTVTINAETKFTANKLDGMRAGDTIQVISKELVYQTDRLMAVEIASPFNGLVR